MPRPVSWVSGWAACRSSCRATQTFRTPSLGASQEISATGAEAGLGAFRVVKQEFAGNEREMIDIHAYLAIFDCVHQLSW